MVVPPSHAPVPGSHHNRVAAPQKSTPPTPMPTLSKDGSVDSGTVEQLLSEKLMQGFLLLETACPSCATPLVKQQQQQQPPPDRADASVGSRTTAAVLPIPKVPFCVWCQAHVLTDDAEVRELETVASRLPVRGTILLAHGRSQSADEDGDEEEEDEERRDGNERLAGVRNRVEEEEEDDEDRDERGAGTYTHLATLDLTTPKPYDERSSYHRSHRDNQQEPWTQPPEPSAAAKAVAAAALAWTESQTVNSLLDNKSTATMPSNAPHPTKSFGTFMSSIFGGTGTAATSKAVATTSQVETSSNTAATDGATATIDSSRMDRVTEQRRAFDFNLSPQNQNTSLRSPADLSSPTSRRSTASRGHATNHTDDTSTDDYEEIEVVHVDDDNQTTLSELERKIMSSEQQPPLPSKENMSYYGTSQAGVERIRLILSEESEQPQPQQQLAFPVLSADASSITASLMTATQPSQFMQQVMTQTTGVSQMAQVDEEDDADGEDSVEPGTKSQGTGHQQVQQNVGSKNQVMSDDDDRKQPIKDEDDDDDKCTVTVEHNFDMVELAHISEDEEDPLPTYDERRDIATKVLGAKMIQGFKLTELQCNKCLMPLMEKNSSYFCVVCPVLKKKFKESLGSLGDDLTEATPKSRMHSSTSGSCSRLPSSASGSNVQDSDYSSRQPSSSVGSQALERIVEHETSNMLALSDGINSNQASGPGVIGGTCDVASLNRSVASPGQKAGLVVIQEMSDHSRHSSLVEMEQDRDSQRDSTHHLVDELQPCLKTEEPLKADALILSNSSTRTTTDHSKPMDIHAALSPRSAVSRLTSVGSVSHFGNSKGPVKIPKTVVTPTCEKPKSSSEEQKSHERALPVEVESRRNSCNLESTNESFSPQRLLLEASDERTSSADITGQPSSSIFYETPEVEMASTKSQAKMQQLNSEDQPHDLADVTDRSVHSLKQLASHLTCGVAEMREALDKASSAKFIDVNDSGGAVIGPPEAEDFDSKSMQSRKQIASQHVNDSQCLELVEEKSTSKHSLDSRDTRTSFETVPEHLLELRKQNQSHEASFRRPDAPAKTLVRSLKSGLVLPTPFVNANKDVSHPKREAYEQHSSPPVSPRAAAISRESINDVVSQQKLETGSELQHSEADHEQATRDNLIATKAIMELRKRRVSSFDSNSMQSDSALSKPGDAPSQSNNAEALCVTMLTEDIRSIKTATTAAVIKADEQVDPCLREAIKLVVNPFAQLDDDFKDFVSLSPPSRRKRKELEERAANLLAEADSAATKGKSGESPQQRQDQLQTALLREKQRAHEESKRLETLEKQFGEQVRKETNKGLLEGLSSQVKAVLGERERDLLQEIAETVKAREAAENEARRLTAELHALKEEHLSIQSKSNLAGSQLEVAELNVMPINGKLPDLSTDSPGPGALTAGQQTNVGLTLKGIENDFARVIAEGDASVVAEVESIVRSQAEDYHDQTEEEARVQRYWETLRVEGRAIMTRRLMGGWILLKQTCLGSECEGRPLLLDNNNNKQCVVCGGSGNGLDGVYAVKKSCVGKDERPLEEIVASDQVREQGSVVSCRDMVKQTPTRSFLDEISQDLGEHVMKTAWNGPAVIEVEDYESKRDFVSKEIGKRMLKGWTLLHASCAQCNMPLMTDLDQQKEICVLCGVVGLIARAGGSIASNIRASTNSHGHSSKPGEDGDDQSRDIRMKMKKELIREIVIKETREAAKRLMARTHTENYDEPDMSTVSNSSVAASLRYDAKSSALPKSGEPVDSRNDGRTDVSGSSNDHSSIPEWLAPSRRIKDASVSPVRCRLGSVSGRISIDPTDTSVQRSIGTLSRGKENASKRADAGTADPATHFSIADRLRDSDVPKPVLSPSNKISREMRTDPPAMQGYAVGRKQAVDADATYSVVNEDASEIKSLMSGPAYFEVEEASQHSQALTFELPSDFDPSDEASLLKLIENVDSRQTTSLTVDTKTTHRSTRTRAEPSPGMAQLILPGSNFSSDRSVLAERRTRRNPVKPSGSMATDIIGSHEDKVDGNDSKMDTKSHRTRALASPGLTPVSNYDHSESPVHSFCSIDSIEPPARFEESSLRKKPYKSTVEMKKVLRGTNSFLARPSKASKPQDSIDKSIGESNAKPMSGKQSSREPQSLKSQVSETGQSNQKQGFIQSFLTCAPMERSHTTGMDFISHGPKTERSCASSSSRPRITPETAERQSLGVHRTCMSSSSSRMKGISAKASTSLSKISSLTPSPCSSREASGRSPHDMHMSPTFSVDQITIPVSKRSKDSVVPALALLVPEEAAPTDAPSTNVTVPEEMAGIEDADSKTNSEASPSKADEGEEALEVGSERPSTPIDLTAEPGSVAAATSVATSKREVIVVGGPLDMIKTIDKDADGEGKDVIYDVTDLEEDEVYEDVYADSDEMFTMSEIRDEDIFGSQYHSMQRHGEDSFPGELESLGSSTLDAVLARIDATKRQLEQAPSGDSGRLRKLIESLAQAASEIEKEDLRDQQSLLSQAVSTPQHKSRFLCN